MAKDLPDCYWLLSAENQAQAESRKQAARDAVYPALCMPVAMAGAVLREQGGD